MTRAGSWRTGLISAPLVGAIGRIVSKGLDVNNRNIKNPKMIKAKNEDCLKIMFEQSKNFFPLWTKCQY